MADQRSEDDVPSSCDLDCWKDALSEAATDFKTLFQASDLPYFRDVLTQEEMVKLSASSAISDLQNAAFECVRVKPLSLLQKIPGCLRAAGNDPLAKELEDALALQRRMREPASQAEDSDVNYVPAPTKVDQMDDEKEPAFVTFEGVIKRKTISVHQSSNSTSYGRPSPTQQSASCEMEMKERLHSVELMMAKLKAEHYECSVVLRKRIATNEGFAKNPAKFLKELIKADVSEFNAMEVLEQAFPYVTKDKTALDAFDQLQCSYFSHCLNPELLVRVAEIIEAVEVTEEQKKRVHEFCKSLTVETFINMREYNSISANPPENLAEIIIKLEEIWTQCTVEQVLQGVSKFSDIAKIPVFLCRLHLIQRGSITISILIPNGLITDPLRLRIRSAMDDLEKHKIVEVKVKDEVLFCLKDKRIQTFVTENQEDLPSGYCTTEQDDTAKMYQLLRICQKHFDRMYEFSHTVPEHFWRYFAIRCLKLLGGDISEATSSHHEGRIAACFKDSILNVSDNCLDRHVEAGRGEKVALVYESVTGESGKVTYKELLEMTCMTANVLKKHGVKKGDSVVIYMPLCPQVVACMLACARIGARHCNIPSSSSTYILKQRLLDANAVALMTVDSNDENSKQHKMFKTMVQVLSEQRLHNLKDVYISTGNDKCDTKKWSDLKVDLHHIEVEMNQVDNSCVPERMSGNDTLFVMYTSGTTGGPKGLEHTQAGYLLYATVTYQVVFHFQPGDVMAFFADPGWIVSHTYTVYGALSSGSTSFLYDGSLRDKEISWLWDLVKKHNISQLTTTPSMLASLMNRSSEVNRSNKPDVLKFIGSVGECLPCSIRDWYREKLNCQIVDHYWQTETGGVLMANRVTQNNGGPIMVKESSLTPFFGVHPILINSKSKREVSRCDSSGNLYLGLPGPGFASTTSGNHDKYRQMYWEKAGEQHGSFKTFDGAYRHSDNGYSITGRVDDVIAIGEEHYDPCDLESTLGGFHIVKQVAAVAQLSVGKETGVMFFVVLKDFSNYNYFRMQTYLRDKLLKFHGDLYGKPVFFVFVKELPTTQSSKTSRHYLREIAAGRGIHQRTDLESLDNPNTPLDINILFSLYQEGADVLAHESADYFRVYQTSLDYPEVFWSSLAKKLLKWRRDEFVINNFSNFKTGHIEWFKEGILNATESCLDRHLEQKTNLVALIHYQADKSPVSITYKNLKEMVCRIANLMIKAQLNYKVDKLKQNQSVCSDESDQGLTQEADVPKKVMICMPLTPLAVASMLACARIGAVHYNVPFDLPSGKLWESFDAVLPTAIVTVHDLKDKVKSMLDTHPSKDSVTVFLAEVPKETILSDSGYKMVDLEKDMESVSEDVEAIALGSNFPLLATFSSVVPSTAIYHSHAGFLLHSAASFKYVLGYQSGDRSAITNDLSSMMSLVYSVYGPLCNGGTAVLFDERFRAANPGWCWEMLSRAKVTQFLTTSDLIEEMRQSDPLKFTLPDLRIIGTSGKQLSNNDWKWLKEEVGRNKWTIIDHYGKPEIGGCLIAPRPYLKQTQNEQAPGSPMVPFFGVSLAILNSDKKEITEPGVEGDLCIKSAIPGMGTHLHGDDDERVMFSNYFRTYPGYYNTGDRATKDKSGNYQIRTQTKKYAATEYEAKLTASDWSSLAEKDKMKAELDKRGKPDDVCHIGIQADYLSVTRESIRGVEECGETVLAITGSRHQTASWEGYGFHLTVPDGAVPNDVTVSIAVKAILSGQFELPDNAHLVSAIYWVSSSAAFHKEVSVHIQHCAVISSEEETSNYKFILAKCSQKNLPYTFKVRDGVFTPESQLATISVKQFSFFAAIFRGKRKPKFTYASHCYLKQVHSANWELMFLVTVNLSSLLQLVKKEYSAPWVLQHRQMLEFEKKLQPAVGEHQRKPEKSSIIDDQSITLEIAAAEEEGDSKNWDIIHLTPAQILKKHVDECRRVIDSVLPSCKLAIDWTGQDPVNLPVLKRRVNLIGAKAPNDFFVLHILPISPAVATSTNSFTTSAASLSPTNTSGSTARAVTLADAKLWDSNCHLDLTTKLAMLMECLQDVTDWKTLGLWLLIYYPTLEKIEQDKHSVNDRMMAMLHEWLRRGSASKSVLVEALKKMKEDRIANIVEKNL